MLSTQLLAELETLSHSARQKRIIELGRDPINSALFDELERGATSYERRLALQSCATSRDSERVVRLLFDSSRLVRGMARRLLATVATGEQILVVVPQLSLKSVRQLLKQLSKHKRQNVADAVVRARLAARPDEAAQPLIAFASLQLADELLQTEFERASARDFGHLADLHPELALHHALAMVRALTTPDGVVLQKANAVLSSAFSFRTEGQRELALQLVRELNRLYPLARLQLTQLFLFGNAQPLAELVLTSGETVQIEWASRARRIEEATFLALVRSQHRVISYWSSVLKRLPSPTRVALYNEFSASWRDTDGAIGADVLALLPRDLRHTQARLHLQIPNIKAAPVQWLDYVALLPADEATEAARPFIGDPDPNYRAGALSALVQNARFERANIGAVLDILQKRGNEQDPVRSVMLSALADLPPTIFAEEHLPALARIQRQALDARDLSYGTASQLERVIVAQLPRFPEWASERIAELLKARGHVSFTNLESRITDAQMRAIGPRLEPLFKAWTAREHAPFLGAMRALGRRLKSWDAGANLLATYLKTAPTSQLGAAASILAQYRRDLWSEIAPQLLEADESWALMPAMSNFLAQRRQDLLSPAILGRRRLQGRFASGRTRQLPPFSTDFHRWTPTQQALFAQTLDEVLRDTSRDSPGAFYAINLLCRLPDVEPTTLLKQSELSNPQPAWREAALRVLSRLDAGQGVPILLESLDDERARIAIYGLRRALLEMPASAALEILRVVPLQKVTVAKEVVRLLGDLEDPAAFTFLLELGERDLHRDGRVALLRALWEHLEDDRSWLVLESAAQNPDPAVATMVARTTHPRMSDASRTRLNAILARLLHHPDARVRLQVLQNGAMGAISDPHNQLLEPLLSCLASPVTAEYNSAARAIWQTYATTATEAIAKAIELLLPRRHALTQVLDVVAEEIVSSRVHHLVPARAILEVLSRDEAALPLYLKIAFLSLAPEEFAAIVESLVESNRLHEGVLSPLIEIIQGSNPNSYLSIDFSWDIDPDFAPGPDPSELLTTFDSWRVSPSPILRRLALAILVRHSITPSAWTTDLRDLLLQFRHDPSPLVATPAQFTFYPGEEE